MLVCSDCAAPRFFHVHTPATTLPNPADHPEHLERPVGFRPNRGRPVRSAYMFCNHRGREGLT
eukprot:5512487-Prymnesium_polylepis.1